jgi:hypothetical protein
VCQVAPPSAERIATMFGVLALSMPVAMHIDADGQLIPLNPPELLTVVGWAVQVAPPFAVVMTPVPGPAIAQTLTVEQLTWPRSWFTVEFCVDHVVPSLVAIRLPKAPEA